jgi:hypothetical protein
MIRFPPQNSGCWHDVLENSGEQIPARTRISLEINQIHVAAQNGAVPSLGVELPR